MSSPATGFLSKAASGGAVGVAFLSYAAFSVADITVKAMGPRLSPYEVAFFLTVFSVPLLPLVKGRDDSWRGLLSMRRPRLTLFRSLASTLNGVFAIFALTHVPIAEAYAVVFMAPILALIMSMLFLAESVGWRRWTSVAAGIAGVLIVMRPGFRAIEPGHLAALCGAFCIPTSIVCLRVIGASERPAVIYSVLTLAGFVIVTPPMLASGLVMPDAREWALMALSGVAGGVGQLLLMVATRRAPANQIAPMQYSQLGWAILYSALFFAELPDWPTIVGLVFIAASGLFLIQRRPKQAVVMPGVL